MCLAMPGRVVERVGDDALMPTARVDFGGIVREVNLAFVPDARPGEHVLVHVGFAIGRIDEAEAERLLAVIDALGR